MRSVPTLAMTNIQRVSLGSATATSMPGSTLRPTAWRPPPPLPFPARPLATHPPLRTLPLATHPPLRTLPLRHSSTLANPSARHSSTLANPSARHSSTLLACPPAAWRVLAHQRRQVLRVSTATGVHGYGCPQPARCSQGEQPPWRVSTVCSLLCDCVSSLYRLGFTLPLATHPPLRTLPLARCFSIASRRCTVSSSRPRTLRTHADGASLQLLMYGPRSYRSAN